MPSVVTTHDVQVPCIWIQTSSSDNTKWATIETFTVLPRSRTITYWKRGRKLHHHHYFLKINLLSLHQICHLQQPETQPNHTHKHNRHETHSWSKTILSYH
ncbi:hypothetical protein B0O80DRAFT_27292 [Mortierella sp. GBAus27b]|nr:hypothetical protein B0O80DRAFT_27292 [Mortierella sp. GBAus27b]